MNSIEAIGYDMDYTLIHYNVQKWEEKAYKAGKQHFIQKGWPIKQCDFAPNSVQRGLVVDKKHGYIVKANSYGYIKQAFLGNKQLSYSTVRKTYNQTLVDINVDRWAMINTLFSISAACLYQDLMDIFNNNNAPSSTTPEKLWEEIVNAINTEHIEGELKDLIADNPSNYIIEDDGLARTLLDQKEAGKKLMIITNSQWNYAKKVMPYVLNKQLPGGTTWRDIFDLIIAGANKPSFFSSDTPIYRVCDNKECIKPVHGAIKEKGAYIGGNATMVEEYFNCSGDQILFVGDHVYSDVNVAKNINRWRTALIMREIEEEIKATKQTNRIKNINHLMDRKQQVEHELAQLRLQNDRNNDKKDVERKNRLKSLLKNINKKLRPLVQKQGQAVNADWGYLLRAGSDKSLLMHQIERYADVYTSRVTNLLQSTPYIHYRSANQPLPHDPNP